MRKVVVLFMLVALFGVDGTVTAQDNTPNPIGQNPIGEPLTVYNEEGEEAAQITVTEVVDDFEDYAEFFEPQRGDRYVFAVVEIRNTGERPYEVQPFSFQLLDSIGHLHSLGFAVRSDQSMVETPDLEEADMLPGEEITGGITYTVAADAELSQLVYLTFGQQLYLLADLTGGDTSEGATDANAEETPES